MGWKPRWRDVTSITGETDGSDRQAAEDSRDPGDRTSTGTATISLNTDAIDRAFANLTSARLKKGGVVPAPTTDVELERVESDMPILAHRIARLRFDGKPPFAAIHQTTRFGVDADAKCEGWFTTLRVTLSFGSAYPGEGSHPAPKVDCSCGFYALPSDVEPWDEGCDFVTLMVELSGTVIEHEKGYRAQHQRVVECQVPACPFCGQHADVVLVGEDRQMTGTACAAHVPPVLQPGVVTVAVDCLTDLLKVPVTRLGKS